MQACGSKRQPRRGLGGGGAGSPSPITSPDAKAITMAHPNSATKEDLMSTTRKSAFSENWNELALFYFQFSSFKLRRAG